MTKFFLLLFLSSVFIQGLTAQITADSDSVKKDTPVIKKKMIPKEEVQKTHETTIDSPALKKIRTPEIKTGYFTTPIDHIKISSEGNVSFRKILPEHPYFNFYGKIVTQEIQLHQATSMDSLFYFIVGLYFYFALIRLFFAKYLNNLFSLFFRAGMRKQQIREQALQTPLPSLLMNIFFVLTSGLYACFVTRYYHLAKQNNFWLLFFYCTVAISAVYISKFLALKCCGWIFNISKAADNYIFVVFLVNKMFGIGLLPFLTVIAFSSPIAVGIAITLSIIMLSVLLIYRFIAGFGTLRSEIKLNILHYFIYLCAFEIAPLLLIYKVVLSFLEKAY